MRTLCLLGVCCELLVTTACGSNIVISNCTSGETRGCTCSDNTSSTQTCSGSAWGSCQCSNGSGGGSGGSGGGSGGTGGGTNSPQAPSDPTIFLTISTCDGTGGARLFASDTSLFVECIRQTSGVQTRTFLRVPKPTLAQPSPTPVTMFSGQNTANTDLIAANNSGVLLRNIPSNVSSQTIKWIPNGTDTISLGGVTATVLGSTFWGATLSQTKIIAVWNTNSQWASNLYPTQNNATETASVDVMEQCQVQSYAELNGTGYLTLSCGTDFVFKSYSTLGGTPVELARVPGESAPGYMPIIGDKAYAVKCTVTPSACTLVALPLAGGAPIAKTATTVGFGIYAWNSTATYGAAFSTSGGMDVLKVPLDGSPPTTVTNRVAGSWGIAADDIAVYWAEKTTAGTVALGWREK